MSLWQVGFVVLALLLLGCDMPEASRSEPRREIHEDTFDAPGSSAPFEYAGGCWVLRGDGPLGIWRSTPGFLCYRPGHPSACYECELVDGKSIIKRRDWNAGPEEKRREPPGGKKR